MIGMIWNVSIPRVMCFDLWIKWRQEIVGRNNKSIYTIFPTQFLGGSVLIMAEEGPYGKEKEKGSKHPPKIFYKLWNTVSHSSWQSLIFQTILCSAKEKVAWTDFRKLLWVVSNGCGLSLVQEISMGTALFNQVFDILVWLFLCQCSLQL